MSQQLEVTKDLWETPWPELNERTVTGNVEKVGLTRDSRGAAVVVVLVRTPNGRSVFAGVPLLLARRIAHTLRYAPAAIEELGL